MTLLPPGQIEWTLGWKSRGTGVAVEEIRAFVLNGLPVVVGGLDVPSALIMQAIDAAENQVELDLDMLIWERDVHCISDQDDSEIPLDDTRIILGALDKPRNWFAGDRFGDIRLPKAPAKKLLRVTVLPYGPLSYKFDLPLEDPRYAQPRLDKNKLRLVPGRTGMVLPFGQSLASYFIRDGWVIPNGLEVVYRAGLSQRQLHQQFPAIRFLVMTQAAILALGMVQGRMMGGAQREMVGSDNLQNSVETAKRDALGPLGGELKMLRANYNALLNSVRSDANLSWVWLG